MTNFIKENSFELTFEGMNIKFTSLQVFFGGDDYFKQNCLKERNLYNESLLYDWCKDGDLAFYVTGQFEVLISGGRGGLLGSQLYPSL